MSNTQRPQPDKASPLPKMAISKQKPGSPGQFSPLNQIGKQALDDSQLIRSHNSGRGIQDEQQSMRSYKSMASHVSRVPGKRMVILHEDPASHLNPTEEEWSKIV